MQKAPGKAWCGSMPPAIAGKCFDTVKLNQSLVGGEHLSSLGKTNRKTRLIDLTSYFIQSNPRVDHPCPPEWNPSVSRRAPWVSPQMY